MESKNKYFENEWQFKIKFNIHWVVLVSVVDCINLFEVETT